MRLKHSDTRPECVIKTVSARLDPEQHSNDGKVKKENNVRHFARGKSDCNNGGAACGRPVRCYIQSFPPPPDPTEFAPEEMRPFLCINPRQNGPREPKRPFPFVGL